MIYDCELDQTKFLDHICGSWYMIHDYALEQKGYPVHDYGP